MSLVMGESPRLSLAVVLYISLLTIHWSIIVTCSMVNEGESGKGNLEYKTSWCMLILLTCFISWTVAA